MSGFSEMQCSSDEPWHCVLPTLKRAKESHSCTGEIPYLTLVKWALDISLKELQGLDWALGNRNPNLVSPVTKGKIPLVFTGSRNVALLNLIHALVLLNCLFPVHFYCLKKSWLIPIGRGSPLHRNKVFFHNLAPHSISHFLHGRQECN